MYKLGSNQYRKKDKHNAIKYLYVWILAVGIVIVIGLLVRKNTIEQVWAQEDIISPVVTNYVTPTQTPQQVKDQKEIEAYIKTIFGKDSKTAIAVSRHECNPKNKQYPRCQFHTDQENSIGIFQINLESATTKVHFYRVPGKTLEEKIEWLKDPFNNTLMAFWIFQKSGFHPWTAYSSGAYLADM